jgi:DNA-binding transcriptional regulator YbjK
MSTHTLSADSNETAAHDWGVAPPVRQSEIVDAAARLIVHRCDHRIAWMAIALEAGSSRATVATGFEGLPALIDACYARTAQGLSDSLLIAETAPGTALDKVAAFLVAALGIRRTRGALLSFRRCADLPPALQRRLHEFDAMTRARLRRLLQQGHRDRSLALRNVDTAIELLLACLQLPTVVTDGPEQKMWDSELVELLLAGLCEPHPPDDGSRVLG